MGSRSRETSVDKKINVRTGVRSELYKDAQGFTTEKELTPHSTEAKAGVIGCVALVAIFLFYCFVYAVSKKYHYHPPAVPTVLTKSCGNSTVQIVGARDSSVYDLGIFYAVPFGSAARWQPPQSLTSGNCLRGTYNASLPGKVCYQFGALTSVQNQSEDCLNLNVWSKNWNNAKPPLPTLVFIHGGGNVYGSANSYKDLVNLVRTNDICVVAPNYRLNAFGFLALKELSANDSRGLNISGNYGIMDIDLALRWIQANIVAFGCDPTRVTLMGHGSGGTNVLAMFASTQASGLFSRAIIWSGSSNISMSLSQAQDQNRNGFLQNSPCANATNVGSCLSNLAPRDILQSIPNGANNGASWLPSAGRWPTNPTGLNVPGLVIVDGDVIVLSLYRSLSEAAYIDVPIWLQSTMEELEIYQNATITSLNQSGYNSFLVNNFAPWSSSTGTTIANIYANVTNSSVLKSYNDLQADLGIFCANVKLAAATATSILSPVYVSVVVQPPSGKVTIYPDSSGGYNAFQGWDFMAAVPSWNFFQSSTGSILGGTQQGSVPGYKPSTQDIAFGSLLRTQLLNFTISGVINGFSRVDINAAGSTVGVLGNTQRNSTITQILNFRQEFCNPLLSALGLTNSDSRFWFAN